LPISSRRVATVARQSSYQEADSPTDFSDSGGPDYREEHSVLCSGRRGNRNRPARFPTLPV